MKWEAVVHPNVITGAIRNEAIKRELVSKPTPDYSGVKFEL